MIRAHARERSGRRPRTPTRSPLSTPETPAARVLALQRTAGNRAVSRLVGGRVLQRDTPTDLKMRRDAPLSTTPFFDIGDFVKRRDDDLSWKIGQYLLAEESKINGLILVSRISMPDVVAMVRANVPEAAERSPYELERMIQERWWGINIPGAGLEEKLNAKFALALPNITLSKKWEWENGWTKLSLTGVASGGVHKGAASASAEVGITGSTELNLGYGKTSVTVAGVPKEPWVGSIAAKTEVGGVKFGAKLSPGTADGPTKWEMQVVFPSSSATVPMLSSLPEIFGRGNEALLEAAAEAKAAGIPDSTEAAAALGGSLGKKLGPVKKSMSALGAIKGLKGATFGIKASGEGPDVKVEATLTIPF